MADVPVSPEDLNSMIVDVARELLEAWAIEEFFTEDEQEKFSQHAANSTVFVVNSFMEKFNEKLMQATNAQTESKLII